MSNFTHLNKAGQAIMVNVEKKLPTIRSAVAQCLVKTPPNAF